MFQRCERFAMVFMMSARSRQIRCSC